MKARESDHYLLKALAHKYKFGPHEAVINNCCLVIIIIVGPVHKVIQYIVDWYSLSNKTWTGITLILWSFYTIQIKEQLIFMHCETKIAEF